MHSAYISTMDPQMDVTAKSPAFSDGAIMFKKH